MTRWWLITIAWCLAVPAAAGLVLLVSWHKGGILAPRPATRIEVRSTTVSVDPTLRVDIDRCQSELDALRFAIEGLLPTWPREAMPSVPKGAKVPRAKRMPKAGSGRKWRKGGW